MTAWPQEREIQFRELYAKGLSSTEIGKVLNVSRSSICSKIHRSNDLQKRGRNGVTVGGVAYIVAKVKKALIPIRPDTDPVEASNPKHWMERKFSQCAFPLSGNGYDTMSCCAPTDGRSYCEAHRKVMYVPERRRRKGA